MGSHGTARRLWAVPILFLILALAAAGCGGDGGSDDEYIPPDCAGPVEGTAYYPFYDPDGVPTYFDEENHDIIVTLHEADGYPYADWVTDTSGAFYFDCVPPGTYFLTAYLEEYDPEYDRYDIYYIESTDFYLGPDDWIPDLNLFLEYSHTEAP